MSSESSKISPEDCPRPPKPIVERLTEPCVPLVCPSCSHALTERKCKRFCERCGYFESCAGLI